ncbi:hypothetical protein [Paenibacillus xylanexedens]|uniref:hypothetical protein n=1 Tax=Paenibacillus xylanexedens TaxID=528191 RepID=UPI003D064915
MSNRTYVDVAKYVEEQNQNKCKVLSAKPEQTFEDLGVEVRVWNVKTDNEGSWWVVEGDTVPMNLYPQDAYYFGTDEAYSFHMGIMQRMKASTYKPEDYVSTMTMDSDIAPQLFRKLKKIATLIDTAVEVEDFQAIGVQCREVLIELGNLIYFPEMAGENEQPQASNFKKKAELFVQYYLAGSDNSDYRSIIKKLTESTWDYSNKITHSQNATFYEASSCVSLCTSLVGVYENVRQKATDLLAQYKCKNCTSKKLEINDHEATEKGIVTKLFLECEECGEVTEIIFENTEE